MPQRLLRLTSQPAPLGELLRALERALATDGLALTILTSGSTGRPREVALSSSALRSSAAASAERLGGRGSWLLALPVERIAGAQVLVRSVLAGTVPARLPAGAPFGAPVFADAAAHLGPGPRFTSLVPAQLTRLLSAGELGVGALRTFDAVLVGGAACPPGLIDQARDASVRAVTTYGMTETAGGCVYDGVPLDGTRVALDGSGRILIAGSALASGYVLDDESLARGELTDGCDGGDGTAFGSRDGVRWVRSSDLGELGADGRVRILGRADDVIVTGGVNVAPAAVESIVVGLPGVREVCVVGVPDRSWGQRVVALVVPLPGTDPPSLRELRARVKGHLGAAHAPHDVVVVDALPVLGPGKVDRRAAAVVAARRLEPRH